MACSDCDVADGADVPTCTNVLDNTKSTGNTIVLETLVIESGYWRATPSSRDILACHNPDACLGGETGAADYCAEGYEGPCTFRLLGGVYCTIRRVSSDSSQGETAIVETTQLGPSALL